MSSGTIKAGTFGQRRWREAQIKTQRENRQRENTIKKEIRKATKGKKRKDKKFVSKARPVSETWTEVEGRTMRGDEYGRDPGGGRPVQRPLQFNERGDVVIGQGLDDRAREIQQVVNTMPLVQDNRYIMQIRQQIQAQEDGIAENPTEDDEMDVGDIQDALHYEAGEVDEEGNIILGASGMAQPEKVDELPEWAGGGQTMPELPDEMTEPTMGSTLDALSNDMGLMGMDEDMEIAQLGQAMASANVDVDEDDEEWERKLQEIADRSTPEQIEHDKALMKEKTAQFRAKRRGGEGRPGQAVFPERHITGHESADLSAGGTRIKNLSKPDGDRQPSRFIGGLAPDPKHDQGHRSDLYQRDKKGQIKYKSGKTGDGRTILAPQLTKGEGSGTELYEGRIMDMRPGYAGKEITTGERSRAKLQTPVREAKSRPVKEGLITAVDRVEYIFDEKQGKTIPNPNFGKPLRVEPQSVSQMKGVVKHPKTRKVLRKLLPGDKKDPKDKQDKTYKKYKSGRYATGDIIEEEKTFSTEKTQKPVEELWGASGQTLDPARQYDPITNPKGKRLRDPWEGRRAVSKDPKKRATKEGYHGIKAGKKNTAGLGEKDVKSIQYQKEQREKDPNYRPSDMKGAKGGFNYGSGVDNWARKDFTEYQSTPATEHRDEVENEDIDDATLSQLKSYAPQDTYRGLSGNPTSSSEMQAVVRKMPKFPSRPDRPRSITNPPMNDLQATNPDPNFPADPRQMKWKDSSEYDDIKPEEVEKRWGKGNKDAFEGLEPIDRLMRMFSVSSIGTDFTDELEDTPTPRDPSPVEASGEDPQGYQGMGGGATADDLAELNEAMGGMDVVGNFFETQSGLNEMRGDY